MGRGQKGRPPGLETPGSEPCSVYVTERCSVWQSQPGKGPGARTPPVGPRPSGPVFGHDLPAGWWGGLRAAFRLLLGVGARRCSPAPPWPQPAPGRGPRPGHGMADHRHHNGWMPLSACRRGLGNLSWHAPFAVHLIALPPSAARLLALPVSPGRDSGTEADEGSGRREGRGLLRLLRRHPRLTARCGLWAGHHRAHDGPGPVPAPPSGRTRQPQHAPGRRVRHGPGLRRCGSSAHDRGFDAGLRYRGWLKVRRQTPGVVPSCARKRRRKSTAEVRPTRVAMASTGRSVCSSKTRAALMCWRSSHCPGPVPRCSVNCRGRGPPEKPCAFGKPVGSQSGAEPGGGPLQQGCQ